MDYVSLAGCQGNRRTSYGHLGMDETTRRVVRVVEWPSIDCIIFTSAASIGKRGLRTRRVAGCLTVKS